jgi:citrate lyase subunit beta/citryl-CoA lyase
MRLSRSLLFVPATATAMVAKAHERGADAVIVDLEDSIPMDHKARARPLAAAAVLSLAKHGSMVLLRVNADPAQWQADLNSLPSGVLAALSAVMLPKVETRAQIDTLASVLDASDANAPRIAALIESPRGVLAAPDIASHPALCALGFGAEDYAAAIGVPPEPAALQWPAQQVLTCAHAYGLQCWGMAGSIADVGNLERFSGFAREARAMGFSGSVCIHPRQVAIVNQAFSPSEAELQWAARVVEADAAAQSAGTGVVLLDGRMIDRPIVLRARTWLGQQR